MLCILEKVDIAYSDGKKFTTGYGPFKGSYNESNIDKLKDDVSHLTTTTFNDEFFPIKHIRDDGIKNKFGHKK